MFVMFQFIKLDCEYQLVSLFFFFLVCLFFRNGKLIEENEKYTLKGSNTELTVRNIINKDGGSYVCKATNKAGEDEKQAFLQVFGKYYNVVVRTQYLSRGKEVRTILCCAIGCKL